MLDVIIVGGGPAGTSSAIRLRQLGLSVTLYEKAHFPRPKLCGGFLSSESLIDLEELGVLGAVRSAGGLRINRVKICSARGIQAEVSLQWPGLSISREKLDAILLMRAKEAGVDVHEGTNGILRSGEAAWIVMATGRSVSKEMLNGEPACYGVQAFFEDLEDISDQVELDLVPGGYVGLMRQGPRRSTVCALTTPEIFQATGPSPDAVLAHWSKQNRVLGRHMRRARRVSPWQAIGPVVLGYQRLADVHQLHIGDAACVVDPFVGEGIAMALRSSALLRDAFSQSAKSVGEAYIQAWHRTYDASLRFHRFARRFLRHSVLQETAVYGLRIFPGLLAWLTEKTRPLATFSPLIKKGEGRA